MSKTPKVSVIVPIYNVEKYLAKCIDSVLAQDYYDWELLLINDGSTDSSGEICDEYTLKDSRIKVFHQLNKGVSAARNLGIENAQGKYIIFIDSDDYVTPQYLSDLVKYDSDIIASGFDLWYANGRQTERKTFDNLKFYNIEDNTLNDAIIIGDYKHLWHGPCCKLYKKATINNIRFDESLDYGEDYLFNLNVLLSCSSITLVPKSNYIYTHYNNTTLTNRRVGYNSMFNYLFKLKQTREWLICQKKINNKKHITHFNEQLSLYYWQTIYTLYQTNNDKSERKKIISNSKLRLGEKIIFFQSNLPKTYRLMQRIFKHLPHSFADFITSFIVKWKKFYL